MDNFSVHIDFVVINTEDSKLLMIGDKSRWGVAENEPAYIKLLPPGSTSWISTSVAKGKINIFNSINLGFDCLVESCSPQEYTDLMDGIWEICLLSNFEGLEKKLYFLKDDSLRLALDEVYIKQGLEYDPHSDLIRDTEKIEFFLFVAKAAVKKGDHVKAKKAYDEAKKALEKYSNCKDCI
jgi:hypothetical protein